MGGLAFLRGQRLDVPRLCRIDGADFGETAANRGSDFSVRGELRGPLCTAESPLAAFHCAVQSPDLRERRITMRLLTVANCNSKLASADKAHRRKGSWEFQVDQD